MRSFNNKNAGRGRKNSHKTPTKVLRISTTVTAVDLVVQAQDAVSIRQVKGGAQVQILDEEIRRLGRGVGHTGALGFARREHTLQSALVAVIAVARPFRVPARDRLVLPDWSASTGGWDGGDAGA